MSDDNDPKIFVDEDWKARARSEKERLDRKSPQASAPEDAESHALPPASIFSLVQEFATRAFVGLGHMEHPVLGEARVDLPSARYAIDMLAVLEEKTRGQLGDGEERFLGQTLGSLRLAFVEVARKNASGGSPGATASGGRSGDADEASTDQARDPGDD